MDLTVLQREVGKVTGTVLGLFKLLWMLQDDKACVGLYGSDVSAHTRGLWTIASVADVSIGFMHQCTAF